VNAKQRIVFWKVVFEGLWVRDEVGICEKQNEKKDGW